MARDTSKKARPKVGGRRNSPTQLLLPSVPESGPIVRTYIASPTVKPEPLSPLYGFLRARQLEGTFPGEPETGVWPITHYRTTYGWGTVLVRDWPDSLDSPWPPSEPEGLDHIAKQRRLGPYQRARNLGDCRRAIAAFHPPVTSFTITEDWFHADQGVIPNPKKDDRIIGSHAVMLEGYDDRTRRIVFVNSWGQGWGDNGIGTMSYEYFRERAVESWVQSLSSSYTIVGKRAVQTPSMPAAAGGGAHELAWVTWDVLRGEILRVFEIYDFNTEERMAWAFAVPRDGFLDVEEFYVRPVYRRRGYGSRLAQQVLESSKSLELPVRLWISYADSSDHNRAGLDELLKQFGLSLWNSPVRWAAYVGLADSSPHELRPLILPDRPAIGRGTWRAAEATFLAASLAACPAEPRSVVEPGKHAVAVAPHCPGSIGDPPASQAPGHNHDEDDDLLGVGYDMVLATPPGEVIDCFVRVEEVVKGREDLPMPDMDWERILFDEDEDRG